MNPAPIIYILGWFIGGAYVYTDFYLWPFRMRTIKNTRRAWFPPKEGEELFNFWIDFAVFILYWIVSWF
jgi:hypothetical protein